MVYRSICHNIFFGHKSEENELLSLCNIEQILFSQTLEIMSDKSKYL